MRIAIDIISIVNIIVFIISSIVIIIVFIIISIVIIIVFIIISFVIIIISIVRELCDSAPAQRGAVRQTVKGNKGTSLVNKPTNKQECSGSHNAKSEEENHQR